MLTCWMPLAVWMTVGAYAPAATTCASLATGTSAGTTPSTSIAANAA